MQGKSDVWAAVEKVRAEFPKELAVCPVDVLTVIEVRMKLDVIPFPNLLRLYSVDAAVKPDFSGIYVDKGSYAYLEGVPLWKFNRLRFSLAHELGHIILHRELVRGVKFNTLEDFWRWASTCKSSKYSLEWEANEFGGRLLVPRERLKADFDKFVSAIKADYPEWWMNASLRDKMADYLAGTYGVHKDVVSCRLDREELWQIG